MKVTITNHIPFSSSKEACLNQGEIEVCIQEGSTVSNIFTALDIKEKEAGLILINGELAKNESILKDGDFVKLFPEIVGG